MNILAAAGIAVVAAALCAMLRRYHAEYAILTGVAAGILITVEILRSVAPAVSELYSLLSSVDGGYLLIVFKALGVCLLTQFSADVCLDAGEKALASRVEFAGRIAVVLLALPLFEEIAEAVLSLTGASK